MKVNKTLLMILDGWGIGDKSKSDAIYNANTPYLDSLDKKYPHAQLLTMGKNVGLPDGQMGNSEVGHLNIGAGRIVYQDLIKINKACEDGSLAKRPVLVGAFNYAKENNKNVHLLGLVSDGGVHSLDKHLYKLCDIAKDFGLEDVYIHALLDGRDTDPKSGYGFIKKLQNHLKTSTGKIASVCGRYYTMDRDKRWKRIRKGYNLMVNGIGKKTSDPLQAIQESYDENITDEFVKPTVVVDDNNKPLTTIQDGDVVICFNFRTDRLREITVALTQKDIPEFDMQKMKLYYVTMTTYNDTFKKVRVIYHKENVKMTLGEYISDLGLKQLRIAETEKFAHVTFFFSGGRQKKFEGEDRILINSPKVATYDLQPEMSAFKVKNALVKELNTQKYDFICLNFANGDMVGHTGIYQAVLKAVEDIDTCVNDVVETAKENDYNVLIIADHGNADYEINPDGSPNTAHSLNPVPIRLISNKYNHINNGILADVSPTILDIMNLDKPEEMTGKSLL